MTPSCVSRPDASPSDDVCGAGAIDGGPDGRFVVQLAECLRRRSRVAREVRSGRNPETRRPGDSPLFDRHPIQLDAVDENAASRRLIQAAEQLHERCLARAVLADNRDDRPWLHLRRHVVEHEAVCPGYANET